MPYAVELLFDAEATRQVRARWESLADLDDSMRRMGFTPHLSLGICQDLEEGLFCEALAGFARQTEPLAIQLGALGAFPPRVLYLAPTPTRTLLDTHRRFQVIFQGVRRRSGYYAPDRWVPHCTLADQLDPSSLGAAAAQIASAWAPLSARVEAIQLSWLSSLGGEGGRAGEGAGGGAGERARERATLRALFPLGAADPFWRIRPARLDEAEAIAGLHVRAWQSAYAGQVPADYLAGLDPVKWAEWRRRNLASPETSCLVIEARSAAGGWSLAGFAMTGPCRDEDINGADGGAGEVYAIYLEPASKGRGYGRALFARAAESLARRGFAQGALWVLESNAATRRFYERAGWRPDGAAKTIRIGGADLSEVRYRIAL